MRFTLLFSCARRRGDYLVDVLLMKRKENSRYARY